jgi:glycosyltransferase involved in cell wall biosynthesis
VLAKHLLSGQALDAAVVRAALPRAEVVRVPAAPGRDAGGDAPGATAPEVDVQIHLEHFFRGYPARRHYVLVNQEFLFDWDVVALQKGRARPLCKTAYARAVLEAQGVAAPPDAVVRFATPDLPAAARAAPRDPRLVVHLAGQSWLKGTDAVLRGWLEHGGRDLDAALFVTRQRSEYAPDAGDLRWWDALGPARGVTFAGVGGLERVANVYLARHVVPAADLGRLAAAAAVHLCPSVAEGWGHIINLGRAAGAVVVTTDAPPMNELVDASCGVLVAPDPRRASTVGACNPTQQRYYTAGIAALPAHFVDPAALMRAAAAALALPADARRRLGDAARARFEADAAAFTAALRALAV